MKIFEWWKRKEIQKEVKTQAPKAENDICPECGGRGYNINANHYLADNDDYERRYPSCRRCYGTGRYHSEIHQY